MAELRALVAAGGRGTRARLLYPKTLYPVNGVPILLRIAALLARYDSKPTVVVSPSGQAPISECLDGAGVHAWLVVQPQAIGMGDAVLRFADSPAAADAEHVLLVWGDIPLIQPQTLDVVVQTHFEHNNDFTFATRRVASAYTVVYRDASGGIAGVVETREKNIGAPLPGERDMGLFVFRKEPVFAALQEELPGKYGSATGEHGFLYVIEHLVHRGYRVEALPLATEQDLISLNALEDLAGVDHGAGAVGADASA